MNSLSGGTKTEVFFRSRESNVPVETVIEKYMKTLMEDKLIELVIYQVPKRYQRNSSFVVRTMMEEKRGEYITRICVYLNTCRRNI